MWMQFAISCLFATVILYLPGFVLLGVLSKMPLLSICFAPAVSLSMYSLVELLFIAAHIECSAVSVGVVTAIAIGVVSGGVLLCSQNSRRVIFKKESDCSYQDYLILGLFLFIGIVAVGLYFIRPLDGPNSFFQGWDNTHHLAAIRTFVNSGEWNPLSSNRYMMQEISPYRSNATSFYPSEWHVLCASVVSTTGISIPAAINCVNAVLIGVVFPVSMFWLLRLLTDNCTVALLFGSLITMGIPACPWDYVIYGPLFPNLMSTALVPLGMSAFVHVLRDITQREWKRSIHGIVLFFITFISITLSHPNGIFTMLLLLSPYFVLWVVQELSTLDVNKVVRVIAPCAVVAVIVLFWIMCFNLPFFNSLVSVYWPSIKTSTEAIADVFLLSIVNHSEQPLVALFLVLGIVCSLCVSRHRWAAISFLLASLLYVVDAGTDLQIKGLLSGFWYTDYHRTGSLVGLMAIILSTIGLSVIFNWMKKRFSTQTKHTLSLPKAILCTVFYCLTALFIFSNRYAIKGIDDELTAFDFQATELSCQYDFELIYYDVMTHEEQLFSEQALDMMQDHSLILGSPNDGSSFLYPIYNANMYYRNARCPSDDSETPESKIIRTRLCDYAFDPEVQEAVRKIDARYVLLLDSGERDDEFRINFVIYHPEEWAGIESIDENTPGFTLLLQKNDMKLFAINRE